MPRGKKNPRAYFVIKADARSPIGYGDKIVSRSELSEAGKDGDSVFEVNVGKRFILKKDAVRLIPPPMTYAPRKERAAKREHRELIPA